LGEAEVRDVYGEEGDAFDEFGVGGGGVAGEVGEGLVEVERTDYRVSGVEDAADLGLGGGLGREEDLVGEL
jgi:hypothetical protein